MKSHTVREHPALGHREGVVPAIRRVFCLSVLLAVLACCGSDPAPGGSAGPSSEECAQRRERLVEDVRFTLQRAADQMRQTPDLVYMPDAFRRVGGVLDTVAASECVEKSEALDTLVEVTDTQRVTERHVRAAQAAFEQWAGSMGVPDAKINYPPPRPDPCPQLRREVRAAYRVVRVPEPGGVRVSLELELENDGSRQVYLDHGGQVRATHVRPTDRTRTYNWGGSSADTAGAFPGRTSTQRIGLVPPGPLHLYPAGRVEVFDLYGSAYSNVGPCRLEVSKAP